MSGTAGSIHGKKSIGRRLGALALSGAVCLSVLMLKAPRKVSGAGEVLAAYQAYEERFEQIHTMEEIGRAHV